MNSVFTDRKEAGQRLAKQLAAYDNNPQAIVLALPRGGVPVAYEIAKNLNLPLDVCLVRKLGLPNCPETAMGAISLQHNFADAENSLIRNHSGNITIIDEKIAQFHGVNSEQIKAIAAKEKAQLKWRDSCYRNSRPMLKIHNSTIIIVDDGIATGLTMQAAVTVLSQCKPKKIIIATPVASLPAIEQLATEVDDIICLIRPEFFDAVSKWYEDFSQTTDLEVCDLLSQQTQTSLIGNRE